MKEIEVKARVRDKEAFLAALKERGIELGEPIEQRDIVFAEDISRFKEFTPNVNFLRIRNQNGQHLFTLKRSEVNETESTEHETEVSKPEEVIAIIKLLGFEEAVRIHKVRRKAKYQDFEICLDDIEHLGLFVEVEKLVESGDIEAIQNELFSFLETLGISRADQVTQGYDTLMRLHDESQVASK